MTDRSETIRMWDGKDYPRSQIERLSPRTAEYAETHEALIELIEFDEQAAWRFHRRPLAITAIAMAVMFGFVCVVEGVTMENIAIATGLLLLGIGFAVGLTALASIPALRDHFPIVVSLRDGILHIQTPDTHRSVPVGDLSWEFGSPARSLCHLWWHPRKEVVLLVLPSESKSRFDSLFESRLPVACALTDEMREHWVTMLTLARVPNRNRKPPAVPQTRTQQ